MGIKSSQDIPKTLKELHDGLDQKRFSVPEVIDHFLNQARSETLGCVLSTLEESARKSAKILQAELEKSGKVPRSEKPLFALPLGLKDLLALKGTRTTCASKVLADYVAPYTATCVSRLQDAGAISIAKLNMDEFAMGGSNENSAFGPVRHPLFPDRVAGGSSGGSAAAVKAGVCLASLGSDTGGSIRLPASFCGVAGVKPTYGSVSRYGVVAFASSLDQVGPMAMGLQDCQTLLEVMSGQDVQDGTTLTRNGIGERVSGLSLKGLKIGIPKEYWQDGVNKEVTSKIESLVALVKKEGATVVDVSLPHTSYSISVYYLIAVAEASSNLSRFDGIRMGSPESRSLFGSEVKRRILLGTYALSSGYYDAYYLKACKVRSLIEKDFHEVFKKVDVLVTPVAPTTAFKLGEKITDPLTMYLNDVFTIPASLAGIPAMSIPCGEDSQGLPISAQLIGPQTFDQKLLSIGKLFESLYAQSMGQGSAHV